MKVTCFTQKPAVCRCNYGHRTSLNMMMCFQGIFGVTTAGARRGGLYQLSRAPCPPSRLRTPPRTAHCPRGNYPQHLGPVILFLPNPRQQMNFSCHVSPKLHRSPSASGQCNTLQCGYGFLNAWSRYLSNIAGWTLWISFDSGLCSVHTRYKHCPLYSVWWCLHISRLYLDLSLEVAHYRPSHYNVIPM